MESGVDLVEQDNSVRKGDRLIQSMIEGTVACIRSGDHSPGVQDQDHLVEQEALTVPVATNGRHPGPQRILGQRVQIELSSRLEREPLPVVVQIGGLEDPGSQLDAIEYSIGMEGSIPRNPRRGSPGVRYRATPVVPPTIRSPISFDSSQLAAPI